MAELGEKGRGLALSGAVRLGAVGREAARRCRDAARRGVVRRDAALSGTAQLGASLETHRNP